MKQEEQELEYELNNKLGLEISKAEQATNMLQERIISQEQTIMALKSSIQELNDEHARVVEDHENEITELINEHSRNIGLCFGLDWD